MNHIEFLQEVSKLRDIGYTPCLMNDKIRLHKDGEFFCPITAVCHNITGQKYKYGIYGPAAKK
jgi:hypothetical protein